MSENIKKRNLIPTIKKDMKSFMLEEKGGASKQKLISFGALLAGIEVIGVISDVVSGAQLYTLHDHCDPGHGSAAYSAHSSADGVPESHCSSHGNGGWHGSVNTAHKNFVYLNYG